MAGVVIMVFGAFAFAFLVPGSVGKGVIASLLTGLPVFLLAKFMPAKTKTGASVYVDIVGFREFMTRAEKDLLERMGDAHLFSKFLPYAMALDVTDNWAKAFEGIYQQPPEWYVSPVGIRTFNLTPSPIRFSQLPRTLLPPCFLPPEAVAVAAGLEDVDLQGEGSERWRWKLVKK